MRHLILIQSIDLELVLFSVWTDNYWNHL